MASTVTALALTWGLVAAFLSFWVWCLVSTWRRHG